MNFQRILTISLLVNFFFQNSSFYFCHTSALVLLIGVPVVYGTALVLTDLSEACRIRLSFNREVRANSTRKLIFSLLTKVIYKTKLPLLVLTKRHVEPHSFYFSFYLFSLNFSKHTVEPHSRYSALFQKT